MNKKDVEAIYPLAPQQQGMLLESLYAAETGLAGTHLDQFTCRLQGPLDPQVFERAWQRVVDRHSVLRTAFVWKDQDEPLQAVLRRVRVPLERHDWRGIPPEEQQARWQSYLAADRQRGFELSRAPLIRVAVFQLDEGLHQLICTTHHVLLDGWCQSLVLNEVFACYVALSRGQDFHPAPSRPYRDYIAWLKKQDLSATKRFWQDALAGFTGPTPLGIAAGPGDLQSETEPYGYHSARLPASLTQALQTLVQRQHLTLNTLAQGVWALLLSRYSGQGEVVFGTTVSGRPADLAGVESMVGLFISTLPLRAVVSPSPMLWPWLKELQARHVQFQHHGYCSAGQIHQWSQVPGALPLYESLMVFENYPVDFSAHQSADLSIKVGRTNVFGAQTNHALSLLVTSGSEIGLQLVYQRRRLDSTGASHILAHFLEVLKSIAANPEQSLGSLLNLVPADQTPRVKPLVLPDSRQTDAAYVAPRTPTEETLVHIWAEVLGIEQVGIHQSFFELGGYSLLALEVASRVRQAFQLELPLRFLFEAPTVAELAMVVVQKQAELADADTLADLLDEIEREPLSPQAVSAEAARALPAAGQVKDGQETTNA